MSDNDMIRRGDIGPAVNKALAESRDIRDAIAAVPARGVGVKPLVWQPTIDSAGNPHTVTVAFCPVFEKRFYAEGPEDQARIDDKRAARILAGLEPADAAQAREAAAVVLDAMKDGEVWSRAVNAAMPIINADLDQSAWVTVSEVREALVAALRAIGEEGHE